MFLKEIQFISSRPTRVTRWSCVNTSPDIVLQIFIESLFPALQNMPWVTSSYILCWTKILWVAHSLLLLLGSIQPRAVLPLLNGKHVYRLPYLLPCFCSLWSPSLGSSMIVAVFLFSSCRAVSTGKSSFAKAHSAYILIIILLIKRRSPWGAFTYPMEMNGYINY